MEYIKEEQENKRRRKCNMKIKGVELKKGMCIRYSKGDIPAIWHKITSLKPFKVLSIQQGKKWETFWTPSEYATILRELIETKMWEYIYIPTKEK